MKAIGGPEAMLQEEAAKLIADELERGRGVHAIPHPAILKSAYKTRALAFARLAALQLAPQADHLVLPGIAHA